MIRPLLCILYLMLTHVLFAQTAKRVADSLRADSLHADTLVVKTLSQDSIIVDSLVADTVITDGVSTDKKYTKWVPTEDEQKTQLPLFQGFTLSFDVFGLAMYTFGDYGTFEGALRLSLKNTWLPIVELGYGICDRSDYNTKIRYKVNAPFLRIGCDWNFLRNKLQDNRMFVGLRWGLSSYKYDMTGPIQTDPIYGGSQSFDFSGTTSTSHWAEIVFGCQVKIFANFHMGWSIRLKYHLSSTKNDNSKAYYIPGYGTTSSGNTWSGSYNLIFDLNWGKPKAKKKPSA